MNTIAECGCKFAIDLFKRRSEHSEKNIISSPINTIRGLVAILLGSKGATAAQIREVLHLLHWTESDTSTDIPLLGSRCDKPGGLHYQLKQLLSAINHGSESYVLKTPSRLYGSSTFEFLENYKRCLKELYNSELQSVNFHAAEKVREEINSWVESQTNGAITNFCPTNSIDPSCLLMIVTATYFKGLWKTQFNPKDTHRAIFWTCKDQSIYVEMMTRVGKFNIANITNPSMRVLELPHEDEQLSSYFLLPGNNVTTKEIITDLNYEKFQEWTSSENMRNLEVQLSVPKITVTDEYSMKPSFISMGMTDLFIPGKADLSGISGKHGLSVNDIRFKGCFKMCEEGTKVAGASRADIVHGSHSEMKVNKPFIIILVHKPTGIVLFFLRICVPQ